MMFRRRGQLAGELDDLRVARRQGLERALSAEHRRLLGALEEADRKPVSVSELEQAGIPSPATLIYELEVAGESIEHVYAPGPNGHRQLAGFRLKREPGSPASDGPRRPALLDALRSRARG